MTRLPYSLLLAALLAGCAARGATTDQTPGTEPLAGIPPAAPDRVVSAPISNVRYDLTYDRTAAQGQKVRVLTSFDVRGTEPVLLSLPDWTPGAYEISNFAKFVADFAAEAGGAPLEWDKIDYNTWRVLPRGAGTVTVKFDFTGDSLDNAMTWVRPDFTFFNGTNLFLYPEGRGFDWPATVRVMTEPGWLVATGMPRVAPNTYRADNYHDLVDYPFFVGNFALDSTRVGDIWAKLATYPAGAVSDTEMRRILGYVERLIPPQAAVFGGEVPFRDYTVLLAIDSGYPGLSGLEHHNSHLNISTPLAIGTPYIPSLISHEIFHAWNVKRLRPAELWPYRYDQPQPTPLLWMSEGITDYYADVTMVRAGLLDTAGFLATTSAKINDVAEVPVVALEDASLSTWIHPADGTATIYYPKGSLAGLLLDILIRDATDNARSLDDVMRLLYAQNYQRGTGFTNAEFWQTVREVAGRPFDDFYRRHVHGREPLPYASVLPLAGWRFVADTTRSPRLGVYTLADTAGIRVTQVDPGSAAAEGGVQPEDYLLMVGDIRVDEPDFGTQFRARYGAGDAKTIPVTVRRGDRTVRLQIPLRFADQVRFRVVPAENASEKARRIGRGILSGD